MVKLAIEPLEGFRLIESELEREGPSYTIDTLIALQDQFKGHGFRLIIGEDVLHSLSRWKEIEKLLELAPPLVGARPSRLADTSPVVRKILEQGLVSIPIMEISSTVIRERLRQGKFCGHLLPGKVVDYISEHHLYY
jgi:nicotinate-nucleotide adenylyltransferase